MDDTYLLFRSTEDVKTFKTYLNNQHKKIYFTSKMEQNGSLSFLVTKINRENNKFVTSVYRKLTFRGVFTKFASFISKSYKRSLIPDFGVTTTILNPVDIFRRWCKLKFGLLRGHVKSRHVTAVLLKR